MKRPIHILFVTQSMSTGGAARVILSMVNALDPQRYKVTILRLFDPLDYQGQNRPHVQFVRSAQTDPRPNHYWTILSGVVRAARSSDIVIGGQEGLPHLLALVSARIWRKPCVDWIHTTWSEFLRLPGVTKGTRVACRSVRFADRAVACSEGSGAAARQFADLRPDRLAVIPNGFPVQEIRTQADEPISDQLAAAFDLPVVIGVGRFHRAKGFDFLLKAHRHALDHGAPPHRLMIVGDGHDRPELEALAAELKVTDTVVFAGMQRNPYPLIKRARLFALSSRYEGLPTVLIEALILGVPPIAFDCPSGPTEILEGGRIGTLIERENVPAFGDAIAARLRDGPATPEAADTLRRRGEDFSIEIAAQRWSEVFESVLPPRLRLSAARP